VKNKHAVSGQSSSRTGRHRQVSAQRYHACPHRCGKSPSFSSSAGTQCGLTPRSSGAPTAGHQARAGGTPYIFTGPGLASCRWRPLSSNVRRHQGALRRMEAGLSTAEMPLCACRTRRHDQTPQTAPLHHIGVPCIGLVRCSPARCTE
jgi:hypothetical protein